MPEAASLADPEAQMARVKSDGDMSPTSRFSLAKIYDMRPPPSGRNGGALRTDGHDAQARIGEADAPVVGGGSTQALSTWVRLRRRMSQWTGGGSREAPGSVMELPPTAVRDEEASFADLLKSSTFRLSGGEAVVPREDSESDEEKAIELTQSGRVPRKLRGSINSRLRKRSARSRRRTSIMEMDAKDDFLDQMPVSYREAYTREGSSRGLRSASSLEVDLAKEGDAIERDAHAF